MRRVVGAFEKVSFPDFGVNNVTAKIDTGATSGSIHATYVKEITLKTGEKALKFKPFGKDTVIVSGFKVTAIKSSNGYIEDRYIVPTTLVMEGVHYPIEVSLANRSTMKKKVLIGRKFLRDHGFIVDTIRGDEYRGEVSEL